MAQPYSLTIQALNNLGGTVNSLNALDLARKNQALEADLNMARLSLQKTQMEGQQKIGLAQIDRQNAESAKAEEWRKKDFDLRVKDRELAGDRYMREEDERQWNNQVGNFEELYRATMIKQGMKPEQINAKLEGMRKIGSIDPVSGGTLPRDQWYGEQLMNTPTTRARMFDVLNDLPRMQSAFAQAARAARGGQGGGSANERLLTSKADALTKTYSGLLRAWDGSDTGMAKINRIIQQTSGAEFSVYPYTETVTDDSGQEKKVKRLQVLPGFVANDIRETERTTDVLSRRPWLKIRDTDDEAMILKKVEAADLLIRDGVYGDPNKEHEIETKYGTNIYTPPEGQKPKVVGATEEPVGVKRQAPPAQATGPRLQQTARSGNYPINQYGSPEQELVSGVKYALEPWAYLGQKAVNAAQKPLNLVPASVAQEVLQTNQDMQPGLRIKPRQPLLPFYAQEDAIRTNQPSSLSPWR